MRQKRSIRNALKTAACVSASGVMLASGCSSSDVRAIVAGVDAATRQLEQDSGRGIFLNTSGGGLSLGNLLDQLVR